MVYISKATKQDLPAIDELLSKYDSIMRISPSYLNKRDVSLQARDESGKLVGFVWAGLLANRTLAYVDMAVIHPDHHHKGILLKLYRELFKICYSLGVKDMLGVIRHDQYHDASGIQALRLGVGADSQNYTLVKANLEVMKTQAKLEI